MERDAGEGAILTDLEPGRIPGGETPPSTAGGTPAATEARFMESGVGAGAMLTGLEPGKAEGGSRLRTRLRLRGEPRFMGRNDRVEERHVVHKCPKVGLG